MLYSGDSTSARYIINGFLTPPVRLTCGLGQGDPASSSVWDISRAITSLAFADDVVVAVAGLESLNLLDDLALDWRHATNGRLNTDKTVFLPIGLDVAGTLGNGQSSSRPQASRSSGSASPSTPAATLNSPTRPSREPPP
ncbi:hypothetical protein MVLG_05704 [Microbotryum lychnidis-dioicae p1A1 Lamole]|uniref:Reverse transcriptase domain-containing protein n=1 Tax=Microbotryum lychnidis-dioicae (strain p1A1 Lamole / MvSl-1064) TaxID=683840 RepID=U5HF17_USTV1|nr:hypothetical protein MVLG_05704 [Microbotryum lychnidis-dioicae p1A1 Lamole]|eukprot:KDE03820.1 hypothetical protein MVLG_05704 [Microbotryum lychnidis-dioicae p1A1 Lamole]